MIIDPRKGQRVQCWYGKKSRDFMPLHGRCGVVVVSGRGRPRNHGVVLDGEDCMRAIPCGNLREPKAEPIQSVLF